jgi:hypothetical protein
MNMRQAGSSLNGYLPSQKKATRRWPEALKKSRS